MTKTCETCKWFNIKEGLDMGGCSYSEPPWAHEIGLVSPRLKLSSRCSKWESKLVKMCVNCEHFSLMSGDEELGECRRSCPVGIGVWQKVFAVQWCGEFRGKE